MWCTYCCPEREKQSKLFSLFFIQTHASRVFNSDNYKVNSIKTEITPESVEEIFAFLDNIDAISLGQEVGCAQFNDPTPVQRRPDMFEPL